MKTHKGITNFIEEKDTIITIGTFDGVHLGHKKILSRLIANAKKEKLSASLLTFFPHPRMVLQQDSDIKLLNTIDEKKKILEKLDLAHLIIHPFTKEFSRLSALAFVRDILVNSLGIKKIIIGYDHRFGRNRNANITDLREYGSTFNFEVEEIGVEEVNDVSISSTKIRKALLNGDITSANNFLGYEYMLTGSIVKGEGLGKKLNFPTANLHIEENYKLIPKDGVYVVKSNINNTTIFGMMNIGMRPTVNGKSKTIETHFFNFNDDLYGKTLQIDLIFRIRDEQKFNSIDELKNQLDADQQQSKLIIANYETSQNTL